MFQCNLKYLLPFVVVLQWHHETGSKCYSRTHWKWKVLVSILLMTTVYLEGITLLVPKKKVPQVAIVIIDLTLWLGSWTF